MRPINSSKNVNFLFLTLHSEYQMLELPKKKKKISITVIEMNFLQHQVISEMTFISYVWI